MVFLLEELSATDLIVTGFGLARRTCIGAETDLRLRPLLTPALSANTTHATLVRWWLPVL